MTIKTKTIELPTFEQLTPEEKEKVLAHYRYFYMDDSFWYSNSYEYAENIGLKITEFDIDYRTIKGDFINSPEDCAESIIKEHGEVCDSYIAAKNFLALLTEEIKKNPEFEIDIEDGIFEAEVLEFRKELLKYYLNMIKSDFEHYTSDEFLIEMFEINEYTFNRETLRIDS